jgi:hypothetical protein
VEGVSGDNRDAAVGWEAGEDPHGYGEAGGGIILGRLGPKGWGSGEQGSSCAGEEGCRGMTVILRGIWVGRASRATLAREERRRVTRQGLIGGSRWEGNRTVPHGLRIGIKMVS